MYSLRAPGRPWQALRYPPSSAVGLLVLFLAAGACTSKGRRRWRCATRGCCPQTRSQRRSPERASSSRRSPPLPQYPCRPPSSSLALGNNSRAAFHAACAAPLARWGDAHRSRAARPLEFRMWLGLSLGMFTLSVTCSTSRPFMRGEATRGRSASRRRCSTSPPPQTTSQPCRRSASPPRWRSTCGTGCAVPWSPTRSWEGSRRRGCTGGELQML